jgi:dihydrofolate reductase
MRKLISFVLTTLDGYHEGPNHEIDWHNADEEFNEFAIEQTDALGTLVFGRVTYEMMAAYWPTPEARESLLRMGLVDEVRILVNPVLLGAGKPLFETADRTKLKLLQTRTFSSGNVLLTYQPT